MVPLIGLNRAIVKQGLKVINSKKNLGLKTLIDLCKIETKASTYHLGYIIGPGLMQVEELENVLMELICYSTITQKRVFK